MPIFRQFIVIAKLGGAGDRFGVYLCVDFANLPCLTIHKQFTNTKFTTHVANISKSSKHNNLMQGASSEVPAHGEVMEQSPNVSPTRLIDAFWLDWSDDSAEVLGDSSALRPWLH